MPRPGSAPRPRRGRRLILLACTAALLATDTARAADDACRAGLRDKTVRWITPGGVGSTYDLYSRVVAPHLAERLGARVVVENIRGGTGLIAMRALLAGATDGTTLGLFSGAQTLIGSVDGRLPDPTSDLTLLGEVGRASYVWAAGGKTGIRTMDDVFRIAEQRPIVFGVYEPAGATFTRLVGLSSLLALDVEYVSGYRGSADLVMAAVRGEVDLIPLTVEGKADLFAGGDLVAVLRSSEGRVPASFTTLPLFDGLAASRSADRDPEEVAERIAGLSALGAIGRLVVAPKDTDPALVPCLRAALRDAFALPGLQRDLSAAGLSADLQTVEAAIEGMERARGFVRASRSEVEHAAAKLRR